MTITQLKEFYLNELHNDVMPFWLKNGIDYENGGYYTCLDRKGELYDTEKSVWFQGRMLWILSKMLNTFGHNDEVKKAADCGFAFIQKLMDEDGRMAFICTADGTPLQARRYYYSETFAAIALMEYYGFTGNETALELSRKAYQMALDIYTGKIKTQPKFNPDVLKAKGFGPPMIMLNVTSIMRQHDGAKADFYNKNIDMFLADIDLCIHPECKCCFESVAPDGSRLEGPRGRFVNPGHSIEGAWFMMNEAEYRGDDALMEKALQLLDWSFDLGWDDTDKGIQYFADIEGKPISQLEWDMRLWWPHCEALIAMIKAYRITGKPEYLDKFMMVHEYTFSHFKDTEYGEWYGYLRRDGSVNNELKGSIFKGPFHIPRALMEVAAELDKI